MRAVSRGTGPAPAALSERHARSKSTELERARAHELDPDPKKRGFPFAAYKADDVKRRLDSLFHGKCAYCETFYSASSPVDVEHYRPKGAVGEDPSHPGYWWLAARWDNLLPSCIDCNRRRRQVVPEASSSLATLHDLARGRGRARIGNHGKEDSFPIAAPPDMRLRPEAESFETEQALLLDPCRDDPEEHLAFHLDSAAPIGLVLPRADPEPSARGATSIQVYGLNRLGLVQDRTRVLRRLEFLGDLAIELGAMAQDLSSPGAARALADAGAGGVANRLLFMQDRTLQEMRDMAAPTAPYSAMAAAWLRRFKVRLD